VRNAWRHGVRLFVSEAGSGRGLLRVGSQMVCFLVMLVGSGASKQATWAWARRRSSATASKQASKQARERTKHTLTKWDSVPPPAMASAVPLIHPPTHSLFCLRCWLGLLHWLVAHGTRAPTPYSTPQPLCCPPCCWFCCAVLCCRYMYVLGWLQIPPLGKAASATISRVMSPL
jgi:hypothetical protein